MSIQSEVEKRNHRKLGQELELFMSSEEAPGMPFYLPNGMILVLTFNWGGLTLLFFGYSF